MTQAGYSGTPLFEKLGVKKGIRMATIDAPNGFVEGLPPLPDGATMELGKTEADVILFFVRSRIELKAFNSAIERMPPSSGMLWVCWPKKTSGVVTDLTENVIRDVGLRAGLVDTKVCAVDETWSGLRFSRRKAKS